MKHSVFIDFKYGKLCRDNAPVALWLHNAERPLPRHQLRINKLSGAKTGQASIGEIHSRLPHAFEDPATETINACELVNFISTYSNIRVTQLYQRTHRRWLRLFVVR